MEQDDKALSLARDKIAPHSQVAVAILLAHQAF
jgi:hypothetical protein